ncbi:exo-beta-N-acetylmuramidase NamZ family protein [Paludifilum halophilum]|uniref:exo-beta-N-acetylmuramidase NamZ family protein n=1 Tax=Paludifilum halophilum TaxID=1642702 RepID=UPI003F6B1D4F
MKRVLGMGLVCVLTFSLIGSGSVDGSDKKAKKPKVQTGLEVLLEHPERLDGKKVGLITNPTGMTRDYRHGLDAMLDAGIDVTEVYGPEHGVRGTEQAGETPGSYVDPRTGLPFVNLYGKKPEEMVPLFDGVDVLVFDIQDVGTRFYTYIYTMAYAMEAAAEANKPFIVLDRPNPLGGEKVEGPVLNPDYVSFVGLYPIPQRHGMTVGELATMFNGEFLAGDGGEQADLQVIRMKGWKRHDLYEETGLPWVLPSPNMPTPQTARVYPGTGMIEGTNLSEGRGTTKPFELIGAPYIRGWELMEALNEAGLPGVSFREAYFNPTFSKYEGENVGGVQLHIEDPERFSPILTGITIIQEVKRLYPEDFAWRKDGDSYWIDKLTGSDRIRTQIDEGIPAREITAGWQKELKDFRQVRKEYLLYQGKRSK